MSTHFERLIETAKERDSLLKSLQIQLESSSTEKTALMEEVEKLRNEVDKLRRERTIIEGDLETAKDKISAHEESSERLRTDISYIEEELVQLKAEKTSFTMFFNELDEALFDNDLDNEDSDSTSGVQVPNKFHQLTSYTKGVVSLKNRLHRALDMNSQLAQELQESRQNESTINDLTNHVERLQSTLRDKEDSLEKASKMKEEADSANSVLSNQVLDLKRESERLRTDNEQLHKLSNDLLESRERLSTEYEHLQKSSSMRENEMLKLKSSLDSSEQERLRLNEQLDSISQQVSEEMARRIEMLKAEFVKRLGTYKETISSQQTKISEMESVKSQSDQKISRLEMDLSKSEEDNRKLQKRFDQYEKATSLKLRQTEEKLNNSLKELKSTKESASIQKEENDSLQNELGHLREIMDIAQESVGELNSLKEENEKLRELVQYHEKRGVSKISSGVPSEIKSKRSIDVNSSFHEQFQDEDSIINERVTALMRENEHNNITLRTLQRENSSLKGSIREFHEIIELMRSEINALKLVTHERTSYKRTWYDSTIRENLTSDYHLFPSRDNPSIPDRYVATTTKYLKTPQPHRRANRVDANHSRNDINLFITSPTSDSATSGNNRKHAAELSAEKELRFKAEEICAGVLANAKTGFEKRDAEIKLLRQKLFKLTSNELR